MKLETRMRQSIKRRSGTVIARSDVAALGSAAQVTHVLGILIQKGELVRLARGLYAKTQKNRSENNPKPLGSFSSIVYETASKLGLRICGSVPKHIVSRDHQAPILVEIENPRIARELIVGGIVVQFRSRPSASAPSPNTPSNHPKTEIASYVSALAQRHNVTYFSNAMDQWADTVTRLAGDEVNPDSTENLIIALKRAGKISKKDVAILTVNHLREVRQNVRSI